VHQSLPLWGLFIAFIVAMIFVDLKVLNQEPHKISIRESLLWTGIWVSLALLFGVGIYIFIGHETAVDYYTGYVIEYSLSADNIFVFLLIFSYFDVPDNLQHNVLFWGIFGALVFRLLFILAGVELLNQLHWVIYIFGGFLIYTGISLIFKRNRKINPTKNPVLKLTHKFLPVTGNFYGNNFFIQKAGKWVATPIFIVLIVIETSDIVFALDSIPAILAITKNQFIVFSSNAFAILGLRTLYFSLSSIMEMFHYLNYGLAAILVFVGIKMLISKFYPIPTLYVLGFIILALCISIGASFLFPADERYINHQKITQD